MWVEYPATSPGHEGILCCLCNIVILLWHCGLMGSHLMEGHRNESGALQSAVMVYGPFRDMTTASHVSWVMFHQKGWISSCLCVSENFLCECDLPQGRGRGRHWHNKKHYPTLQALLFIKLLLYLAQNSLLWWVLTPSILCRSEVLPPHTQNTSSPHWDVQTWPQRSCLLHLQMADHFESLNFNISLTQGCLA